MTAAIHAPIPRPHVDPMPVTAVIAENDLFDDALLALLADLGFPAVLLDLDAAESALPIGQRPIATLIRSPRRLAQVRTRPHLRSTMVIAVGDQPTDILRSLLAPLFPTDTHEQDTTDPVHVTPRELEVLTTYIMGTTMNATAKKHFIAESTVRAHYRRVTDRYALAARPVNNKAQLLLALIADGWISPNALLGHDHALKSGPAVLHAVPACSKSTR